MKQRVTREQRHSPAGSSHAQAVERELEKAFTPAVIDELGERTGYNPRQRTGTALRVFSGAFGVIHRAALREPQRRLRRAASAALW